MVKKDWIISVVACAGDDGLTPLQLQKSLFLFNKAFPSISPEFYDFKPYNYGPFDVKIYNDADEFTKLNYINKIPVVNRDWGKYRITKSGEDQFKNISLTLNKKVLEYLMKLVSWVQSLTFQELVTSIYEAYPEYKINSVFRNHK